MNLESGLKRFRGKRDYLKLKKILNKKCDEILKDNNTLSCRLVNLKLMIHKAENQCRKLQDRLEKHGIDYQTIANAYSTTSDIDCGREGDLNDTLPPNRMKPKLMDKSKRNQPKSVDLDNSPIVKEEPGI